MPVGVPRSEVSDLALVLRRFDFGETSQTAKLLTREHGRIAVLAKGIKRPQAGLRGPMDLFHLAKIGLRWRPRSDLHLLVRYDVLTGHRGLRRNLERLGAGFYVTEVLREGTRDEDPQPALFDLGAATLLALEEAAPSRAALLVAWFELSYLDLAGFSPQIDACMRCARRAPSTGPVRFAPALCGLVCRECLASRPSRTILLPHDVREVLRRMRAASRPAELADLEVAVPARRVLREFLTRVLLGVMERELHSTPWVSS